MRNRAKCKLCHSIIESLYKGEWVYCLCNEIAVFDGPEDRPELLKSAANDFSNMVRLDDDGGEHAVTYAEKAQTHVKDAQKEDKPDGVSDGRVKYDPVPDPTNPSFEEIVDVLKAKIDHFETLPSQAQYSYVIYSDLIDWTRCLVALFQKLRLEQGRVVLEERKELARVLDCLKIDSPSPTDAC